MPLDWQTRVAVPIFKKKGCRVSSNYRMNALLSLLDKIYSGFLERVIWIVEPQIQKEQCDFCPDCGTLNQLYTLRGVLEDTWEFTEPVYKFFVDLEKVGSPAWVTAGV